MMIRLRKVRDRILEFYVWHNKTLLFAFSVEHVVLELCFFVDSSIVSPWDIRKSCEQISEKLFKPLD